VFSKSELEQREAVGVMRKPSFYQVVGIAAASGLLFIGASSARAHNTWLVSSRHSSKQPTSARLALVTTEHFPTSEYRTSPHRVAEWVTWISHEKKAIRDYHLEGLELVADVYLDKPGVHVIAVALHPRFAEFEGPYFNQYLADEHATAALAKRRKTADRDKPGRMYYTKLVKTFVEIDAQPTADYETSAGHALEIIPLSNPCRWQVGDRVTVRVLYEGRPAANLRVSSGHEHMAGHRHRKSESHDYVESVLTDEAGKAALTLNCPGLWFFRTHLIRPVKDANENNKDLPRADWESFWASITFRVHDRRGEK